MARATVTITAQDKMSPGLMQAKKNVMQFQQSVDKVGSALGKAFKVTSITAGIVALGKAMTDCVREFSEADKVSRRLSAVWENVGSATGKSARAMDDYAEAMEKTTYFTSESIKEAGLLLAATESLTDEGFDRALQASMDLAAAMGTDVASAAQTLSKAIQEPEASLSRLKTIGVSFTEEEKAQIKALTDANQQFEAQNLILEKVEAKYKGVAQAVADTPTGKLKAISDTFGDIKETIGQGIVEALDPAFTFILEMLQRIHKWAKDHVDEKHFWKDADMGDSHRLYSNYSDTFLQEKQAESAQMLAEQLQLMRTNPWGGLLENRFGKDLSEILQMNTSMVIDAAIKEALKEYGPEYAKKIGTVQGFAEIIADQYEPLLSQFNAITGALQEYADAVKLDKPDANSNGTSSTETEIAEETSTIADFLQKYGNASLKYQKGQYQAIIDQAEALKDEMTVYQDDMIHVFDGLKREEWGFSIQEFSAFYDQLNEIIETYKQKIDALYPTEAPTFPSPTRPSQGYETEISYVQSQSFLDSLSNSIAEAFIHNGIGLGGQAKEFGGSVVNSMTENMGKAGEVAGKLATNMATMGPLLGAIATALEYIFQGLNESIGPALDEMMNAVIIPLVEVGKSIGRTLLPIIKTITPILTTLGKVIVGVSAVFEWVGQLLTHWAASFVNAFTWITGFSMYDPGSPGNIVTFVGNRVDEFNNSISGAGTETSSTGTAVASAQYRGATSVTINIYQEAPVVGDNGMRQFAQMIRDEFNALDYYGVTT